MKLDEGDRVIVPCGYMQPDYAVATIAKIMPKTYKLEQTPEDIAISGKKFGVPRRPDQEAVRPWSLALWQQLSALLAEGNTLIQQGRDKHHAMNQIWNAQP